MLIFMKRPITEAEAAVVRRALEVALTADVAPSLTSTISGLVVVGGCDCGCPSVDFAYPSERVSKHVIADGVGLSSDGSQVGVIVWDTPTHITGLEVYGMEDPHPRALPAPQSVRPWEAAP